MTSTKWTTNHFENHTFGSIYCSVYSVPLSFTIYR